MNFLESAVNAVASAGKAALSSYTASRRSFNNERIDLGRPYFISKVTGKPFPGKGTGQVARYLSSMKAQGKQVDHALLVTWLQRHGKSHYSKAQAHARVMSLSRQVDRWAAARSIGARL